jgi:hypothetical protein
MKCKFSGGTSSLSDLFLLGYFYAFASLQEDVVLIYYGIFIREPGQATQKYALKTYDESPQFCSIQL